MRPVLWQTKTKVQMKVSFPLEDKHVVNVQEKCPRVAHFNVTREWFETNSRHQQRYSEGGRKNLGCRGLLERAIKRSSHFASKALENGLKT